MINKETIKALRDAIEKCGGRGGTPGPCAGPKKPPKTPVKPAAKPASNPNRRFTQREQEQWDAHDKKKPPKKPKTLEAAVLPHFDEIQKSRKKVHQLALKLGFKPTSKDPDVAVQQAMEWAQVRAAKKVLGQEIGKAKPEPRKPKQPAAKPASNTNRRFTQSEQALWDAHDAKKKPPAASSKKPPKKPKNPEAGPKKPTTVDDITNEAKSVLELTKSPETRRVDVGHPTIARLAGRSFSKVVQTLAGMKPSEIWPNRRQAAKNLVDKFKTEFTDENAEKLIQTAVSHVKKVFTKEGAAARIMSHFLKEQPW